MAAIIGYGVYYGVKKYQKRRDNKKQAAEEQLQCNNSFSVADPSLEILGRQSIPSKRPLAVSSYPSYYTESVYSQPDTLSRDRHNSPTFTQFVDNQMMSSRPPSYEESVSPSHSPASSSHASNDSDEDDDADALSLLPTPLDLYSASPPAIPTKSPYRSSLAMSSIQTQMAELDSTSPVSPTSPTQSYRAELADTSPVSPTAPNAAVGTSLRRAPRRSSLMMHEAM